MKGPVTDISHRRDRMAGAHDDLRAVGERHLLGQVFGVIVRTERSEQEVDFAVAQGTGQFRITAFEDGNLDTRVMLGELQDRARQPARA